ncbi:hypothetical protein SprV_0301076500 [Sparganum proliferum]
MAAAASTDAQLPVALALAKLSLYFALEYLRKFAPIRAILNVFPTSKGAEDSVASPSESKPISTRMHWHASDSCLLHAPPTVKEARIHYNLCGMREHPTFDGTIYEQVKGTPMGSPISGLIAEAVLQRLESPVFQHHRPKFWSRYVDDNFVVFDQDPETVGHLPSPLEVGVAHRPKATIKRRVMKPKNPRTRQVTSGVVYRIWCSCGQSNYVGNTERQLGKRMVEHTAAVRRNDANSQVAAHSTRSGHTFKFDETEILARGDNRMRRELSESWFTGPQSIKKCNDLPLPYSTLRLRLGGVVGHAGSAQVNTGSNTRVGASDGRAIITPTTSARDEIAAINDSNFGHQTISTPSATILDEGGSRGYS